MAAALAAAGVPPTKRVEIALNQQAARSSGAAPLQSANKEERQNHQNAQNRNRTRW